MRACWEPRSRRTALWTFSSTTLTTTTPQQLPGWSFGKDTLNNDCWEVKSGKLQIKNFGTFSGTCTLTLPSIDLTQTQYSQYSSVTLAVRHTIDLDLGTGAMAPNQLAQVYLSTATPTHLVTETSGSQPFEQQLTLTIDKQKLAPAGLGSVYKWLLQVSSGTSMNKNGWQISSIAVLGNL